MFLDGIKINIYRTIILPVVLYGCETWSLTLREERKLRVLENMVLRRIFGPRRDEVTGEWRRLHKEELNDDTFALYSIHSLVIITEVGSVYSAVRTQSLYKTDTFGL